MSRSCVIFGGSFNPPGLHHYLVAQLLLDHFDEVVIVPCGPRGNDKPTTDDVDPVHRAAMVDLTFGPLADTKRLRIDLFDLEQGTFTRTHDLQRRYAADGANVWHYVGSDLISGGASGSSAIQRTWFRGTELWHELQFAIGLRPGHQLVEADLPPKRKLLRAELGLDKPLSSSIIRRTIFDRQPFAAMVRSEVLPYVTRWDLYRGKPPRRRAWLAWSDAGHTGRPFYTVDDYRDNPAAAEFGDRLRLHSSYLGTGGYETRLVCGGDGTMLQSIRKNWRERLPFIGANFGRVGFLLNDTTLLNQPEWPQPMVIYRLPILHVEIEKLDGSIVTELAFNEAWLKCGNEGQSAWIDTMVDLGDGHVERIQLRGDGVLLASPGGSTAYARVAGAQPLPPDAPLLTLVGLVTEPTWFKPAALPLETVVTFTNAGDVAKRPVVAFVDGQKINGAIRQMTVRTSRIAQAELAFFPQESWARKVAHLQFSMQS